ncbi:MAG: hypothetical protein AB1Z19_07700 [Eubacteriales bacterium]
MNWNPLVGLLALVYGALCLFWGVKKPEKIWEMGKIKMFRKVLGEKGTVILFFVFGVAAVGVALWLFIANPIPIK